ncbi:MAG: histidine kinase [bacterium]|nr:histidine kinase [bacterium]
MNIKRVVVGFALLSLLMGLCTGLVNASANVKFRHLTVEDGLSQGSVYCILQDSTGFLWFGTQDGLNRYDGYNFTVYKNDEEDRNSLSQNWVKTIIEDSSGIIWIGTFNRGLNSYEPEKKKFTRYRHDPTDKYSLSADLISSIYEDSSGSIWVGTTDGGLNKYDKRTGKFALCRPDMKAPGAVSLGTVNAIYEDRSGRLWIGSQTGLNIFDRETARFTRYYHDKNDITSLSENIILSIYEDRAGNLWIGTVGGLNLFNQDSETFTRFQHDPQDPDSICSNIISCILEDKEGALWIGTGSPGNQGNGVCRLIPDQDVKGRRRFLHYPEDRSTPFGLNDSTVLSLFEDSAGTLWFGTLRGGLNKSDKSENRFGHYSHKPLNPNSLSENTVLSFLEDDNEVVWIGTLAGGLNRYDRKKNTFKHYKYKAGPTQLPSNAILRIYRDRAGTLWIGTGRRGLSKYNPRSDSFTSYNVEEPGKPATTSRNSVSAMLEDSRGIFWLGTWHGLFQFDRKKKTFKSFSLDYQQALKTEREIIFDIMEDRDGDLWVCTYGKGLFKYAKSVDSEVRHLTSNFFKYAHIPNKQNSISSNNVHAIYEDRAGNLWLGTDRGLNRYNKAGDTFTRIKDKFFCAPGNHLIMGILEDNNGNLWLSSNKGLLKYNPKNHSCENYNSDDGVQGKEFNQGAFYKNSRGEMFFGGTNGFNVFFPERIVRNPHSPPIVVTSFKVFEKEREFGRSINKVKEIRLSYKEKVFAFEFAALDFVTPRENRYSYRLEGFDSDWINCGTRRYASYTNLDGGEYVFRIKGANSDGVWNHKGTSMKIIISQRYWRTRWFLPLLGLLFFLLLYGLHRIVTASLRRQIKYQPRETNEIDEV